MVELLNYPFDSSMILRKRKGIRKELIKEKATLEKKFNTLFKSIED